MLSIGEGFVPEGSMRSTSTKENRHMGRSKQNLRAGQHSAEGSLSNAEGAQGNGWAESSLAKELAIELMCEERESSSRGCADRCAALSETTTQAVEGKRRLAKKKALLRNLPGPLTIGGRA